MTYRESADGTPEISTVTVLSSQATRQALGRMDDRAIAEAKACEGGGLRLKDLPATVPPRHDVAPRVETRFNQDRRSKHSDAVDMVSAIMAPASDQAVVGTSESPESDRVQLSLPLLVRLRWWLLAAATIAVLATERTIGVDLPLPVLLILLALAAATNEAIRRQIHRGDVSKAYAFCRGALGIDILVLTAILHATGGSSNPFSVVYLVYITLGAVLLGPISTWGLTLASICAYGSLFFLAAADPHAEHNHHSFAGHLQAMWIAFSLTAVLTAGSVARLTAAIARRDRELKVMRERAGRSERLAALTTLAAGAAHELGTPLGTIGLAAGELAQSVAKLPESERQMLGEDVHLILSQLGRCRQILEQMSAAGGEFLGEAPLSFPLKDLIEELRAELSPEESRRLTVNMDVEETTLVPHRAFTRVLLSLLRNAFDASAAGAQVQLRVEAGEDDSLEITVRDEGRGMSAEVLSRASEPFFTTKPTGKHMGMGLFLASALAEQLGGHLALASTPAAGTTAVLRLPQRPLSSPPREPDA